MFWYYRSCNDPAAMLDGLKITQTVQQGNDFILEAAKIYAAQLGFHFDEEKIDAFIKQTLSEINKTYIALNEVLGNDAAPILASVNPPLINSASQSAVVLHGSGFDVNTVVEYDDGSPACPCRFEPTFEQIPNTSTLLFPAVVSSNAGIWSIRVVKEGVFSESKILEVTDVTDAEAPPVPSGLRYTITPYIGSDQYIIFWDEVNDASGLAALWWKPDDAPVSCTDGTRKSLPLHNPLGLLLPGADVQPIHLWFEDGAGNCSASQELVLQRDNEAPIIQILEPVSSTTFSSGELFIELAGTASDVTSDIAVLYWQNENGEGGDLDFEGNNWQSGGISLNPGENKFTVVAEDQAGLLGYDSITIQFSPPAESANLEISDDFESGVISTDTWAEFGSNVGLEGGLLYIEATANPEEGRLYSQWVSVDQGEFIVAKRDVYIFSENADEMYDMRLVVEVDGAPEATFGVAHIGHDGENESHEALNGIYVYKNNANPRVPEGNMDVLPGIPALQNVWFTEELRYNGIGELYYLIDGQEMVTIDVDALLPTGANQIRFGYFHVGTERNTFLLLDDVEVSTYGAEVATHLEEIGSDPRQSPEIDQYIIAYPNPVTESIIVRFGSHSLGPLRLSLIDILGREVRLLFEGHPGYTATSYIYNISTLPAGVYVLRLQSERWQQSKMIVKQR